MKQLRAHRRIISGMMVILMTFWQIGQPLQAATFYWDTDTNDVGNVIDGTNLGGTGDWDASTSNWWDGTNPLGLWPNSLLDTALFNGTAGVVTLGSNINAGTLMFQSTGYQITGANTLTLGDVARVDVAAFTNARIDSVIAGSAGFLKTGNGTLFLGSGGNTYSGDTVINAGALVITNQDQLGTSGTAISINGIAQTGNPGYTGGQLVVNGVSGTGPVTMTREISISGRGPGAANASGGLVSVGNNTFNGDISLGGPASEGRILATHGTTTINGDMFLGTGAANLFFGNGNFIVNGRISGIDTAGDRFIKSGLLIGTTLWLTNSTNDFRQPVRVDSGTIRVSGPNALGALGNSTSTQALDSNGAFFEIHTDVTDFSTKSFRKRGNGGGIFADHDFGSTLLNQNILLNDLLLDANASFQVNARNGYGVTFTPADGVVNWTNGGTGALTNNGNGVLQINADINRLNETSARTFTITGNGTTVLNGNLLQTGTGAVSLVKSGTGVARILGTASTATGTTTISAGTLEVAAITSLSSGTLNIGNATTTSGALTYIGAGETSGKTINLNTTTASVFLNNDGTGALILNGTINAVTGNKTLFLGGSNADANEIASVIPAAGGTLNLNKHGAGTWVLSGANLYTGTTTVAGGTLQVKDTFSGTSRNVIVDTSNLIFNTDARTQAAGGIFEYLGDGANASAEVLGSLLGTAGAGTVMVTAGPGGSADLTFSSLGVISAGSGINFVTSAGASVTLTGATDTNGILNAHLFFNGADFASSTAGLIGAASYTEETAGASLVGGNTTPFHVHTADIAAQATATINAGIKFSDNRLFTLGAAQTLTLQNGAATVSGGILVTGGSTVTISGGTGISTGGANDLVFRTDTVADVLNLNTPILAASTGGWTKLGLGTLVLGANNAGTTGGQVHINEGTVMLGIDGADLGADSMDVRLRQGATLDLNGFNLGTAASATGSIDELNGAGILTNTGAAASIRVGNGNGSSTFTGEISGLISIAKNGTGTVRVQGPQSYTGVVQLNAGNFDVSHLANIGQASGLGTGDATDDASNAASLVFNGGVLRYIGQEANNFFLAEGTPSVSIDRLFTMAGNGTISNFASAGQNANQTRAANHATLVFNNTAAIAFSGAGNRTLTLSGDSLGDNYLGLQLIDNPNTGILNISKSSSGLWILGNATNSYTGITTISGGALRAQDGTTLPTASNLLLNGGGGVFQTSGTFTRALGSGANEARFGTADQRAGFAASEAPLIVNLGTPGLVWGSSNSPTPGTANFLATGTLYLSSSTSWADTTFANDFEVTAGIDKNVTVSTASNTTVTLTTGNTDGMTVGQAISGTNIPAGAYIVSVNSATQVTINANATGTGTGIAATVSGPGHREIRVDDNTNTGLDYATVSGVISGAGGLGKVGAGLLVLGDANTYSGNTTLREGFLTVTSIGSAGATTSSLGTNVGGGFLQIGNPGATTTTSLLYVGGGEIVTREINLVGSTGTRRIDSSGSGALILTALNNSSASSVNTTGGAKTLEIRGNNTDGNMITSVLANNGGALTVSKFDGGVWILNPTSANTFTGTLTAGGGSLGLTADGVGSAAQLNFSNGAIFAYGGDLSLGTTVQWNNNTTAVFAGSNNITLNGTFQVAAGNNDGTFSNNLENGAVLTINSNFNNLKANNRSFFIRGFGDTVWNGSIQDAAANTTAWDIRIGPDASFTTTGAANTYTGNKTLGQGTFILDKLDPLGPGGAFVFSGGTITVGPSIADLAGANAIANNMTLNGDPATISGNKSIEFSGTITNSGGTRNLVNDLSGGATLTLSGPVNLSNDGTSRTLSIRGTSDTTISGVIANGSTSTASALQMRGTGTLTLTNANTYGGVTTVSNGVLALSDNGTLDQNSVITVQGQGVLRLDNSVTNLTDRVNSDNARDINLDHGALDFIGNAGGSSETFGRLDINGNGMAKITVSGGDSVLTFGSVNFANTGSSLSLNGIANLGTNNQVFFTTAPTGAAVSNSVLSRVAIGSDFAEYDGTNGVQAFTGYNHTASLLTPADTDTVNLTTSANIGNSRILNALRLDDDTGFAVGSTMNNSILTLTSGALIATGGGTHTLNAPIVNTGSNGAFFQVTFGTTLNIDSALTGSAFTTLQDGTINFNAKQFFTSTFNQHAGIVKLDAGLNTLMPLKQAYFLNSGATLDLNGNTQFIGNLTTSGGGQPGDGGSLISSSGTGTLVTDNGGTWMGAISGDVNLGRVGGGTLTIGSAQTYTGWTFLTGGTTTLRDNGTLANTSGIDVNVATLFMANNDNLQILNTNRVNDSAAINLRAGNLTFTGTVKTNATESLGAVSALLGANTIASNSGGLGTNGAVASSVLTIASLTRAAGTTINFTGTNLGSEGNNAKIIISSPLTAIGNGVLGAWAIANTSEYAAYNQTNGIGVVGNGGFVGYDADFASGSITNLGMNSAVALSTTLGAGTTTTSLLRFHGAFTNDLEFTNGSDILHLELGGILRSNNNNLTNIGSLATRGNITSGASELVVYNNQSTLTIHSVIQGATSLVKSGAGTLTLTANNTYSGGTVVNQGTLRLEGDIGALIIPDGGLTITSGTVTMITNAGQIGAGNAVTLNGSSTLTLVGNNTLDSLVFNHIGGTTNPTVTTNGILTLANATPIDVTGINSAVGVPTVNGFLNFGTGAKTINVAPIQLNGVTYDETINRSLNIGAAISGTVSITKTGAGLLGLGGQSTFNGGLTVAEGGIVLYASSTSTVPNGLVSGPLGIGTVAMAAGTRLSVDDSSRTVANAFTFASDPIFGNTGTTTDTMTLNGALTFSTLGTTGLVANVETPYLNVVLGGPITGMASVTSIGSGSGANTITKTGPGNISGINLSGISNTATINLNGLTNLNTFSLLHDGDGTSGFETINLGAVTWDPANGSNISLTIGRAGTGVNFPQPAFKTIELAGLTSSVLPNGITLANNNGYGLVIPDAITLASGNTWTVNTANTSLQVPGLTLNGQLGGSNGITKAGNGTLKLGNTGNDFTGTVAINDGTVEGSSDAVFGNAANTIQIGSNSLAEGLRISGSFATNRTIHLNAASTGIDVTEDHEFTLNTALTFSAANNALRKNDRGTLVLTQAQAGWDGVLTIGQGVLRISDGASLGTTTGNVIIGNLGASLQIDGSGGAVTVADAIRIASTNNSSSNGINSSGAIHNLFGTNTLTGAITIDTTTVDNNSRSGTITADLGSVLNVEGGIVLGIGTTGTNRDNWIGFGGQGTINLTTTGITRTGANGVGTLTKFGAGILNIQVANAFNSQQVVVKTGTLSINGAGSLGASTISAPGTVFLNPTGVLILDNSGTNVDNRLGGRNINISGADLTIIGNSGAATSETVGTFALREGTSYFTLDADPLQQLNFTTGAVTRSAQATLVVRGDNLGDAADAGVATISGGNYVFIGQTGGTGSTNKSILPWAFGDTSLTGEGVFFLTADSAAAGANTGTNILRPLAANEQTNDLGTAFANVNLTTNESLQTFTSFNSLRLDNGGGVTLEYVPLTLESGGLIALAGNTGISGFSGVSYLTTANNAELSIHTVGDLALPVPIAATTGSLTKSGAGILTLTAGNAAHSTVMVNGGTLRLGGGDQTVLPGRNMFVNEGGTLDLNGTVQQVNILESRQSAVLARNDAHFGGGTVTNSSMDQATLAMATSSSIFAGTITGNIAVARATAAGATADWNLYVDQTYTGPTLLAGGRTILQDTAALTATPSIEISNATFLVTASNNATEAGNQTDRIYDNATITMDGAMFQFRSRAALVTTETLGALTLKGGNNIIDFAEGGTAINNSTVTLASLAREAGSRTTVRFLGIDATPSSGQRLFISNLNGVDTTNIGDGLTNHLIGGWALFEREFASYTPGQGVGGLNTAGFAGYSPVVDPNLGTATDNVRILTPNAGSITTLLGDVTLNSLNIQAGTASTDNSTLDLGGNTLTLASGGLILSPVATTALSIDMIVQNGSLSAGTTADPADLYLNAVQWFNGQADTTGNADVRIDANIVNNSAGGAVTLVISGGTGRGSLAATNDVIFTGNNTHTGGTFVNSGQVRLNNSSANGSTIFAVPGDLTVSGGYSSNPGVFTDRVTTVIWGGSEQMANTGNLTVRGGAILNLNNFNQTVATLTFDNNGGNTPQITTGSGTLTVMGDIIAGGQNVSSGSTRIDGKLNLAAATTTITVNPVEWNNTVLNPLLPNLTINAPVEGGNIIKDGTGVLRLSANNAFSGTFDLQAGGVLLGSNNAFSNAIVTIGDGTFLSSSDDARVVANDFILSGHFALRDAFNLRLGGAGSLAAGIHNIDVELAAKTLTLSGVLTGVGAGINKIGNGILVLSNNSNAYTGGTTVTDGILTYGGVDAIPTASALTVLEGALVDITLGGAAVTVGSIASDNAMQGGVIVTTAGSGTTVFTAGVDGTDTVFGGVLVATSGATLEFVKTGAGALTLGGGNLYNGSTTVAEGRLIAQPVGGGSPLGTSQALVMGGGMTSGILQLGNSTGALSHTFTSLSSQGSGTANAIVSGNATTATLTLDLAMTSTFAGNIGGAGMDEANLNLVKNGAGDLVISGTGTSLYNGSTAVNGGKLFFDTVGGFSTMTTSLTVADSTEFTLRGNTGNAVTSYGFSGVGGVVTVGSATGATLGFGIDGAVGVNQLVLTAGQTLQLSGTLTTAIYVNGAPVSGNNYVLIDGADLNSLSGFGGTFDINPVVFNGGSFTYALGFTSGLNSGGLEQWTLTPTAVPSAPDTWWTGDLTGLAEGVWSATLTSGVGFPSNWATASDGLTDALVPPDGESNVHFSAAGAANFATTLGANMTIKSLTFHTGNAATTIGSSNGINTLTLGNGVDATFLTLQTGVGDVGISAIVNLPQDQSWNIEDVGNTLTLSGGLTGSSRILSVNDTATATGTLLFSGSAATMTGTLFMSAGNLVFEDTGSLNTGLNVVLGTGTTAATLRVGGTTTATNVVIGGLSDGAFAGSRVIGGNAALSTLTIGGTSGTATFTGALGGGGLNENQFNLVKAGAGTQILDGAATYAGDTTVNEGTLQLGAASTFAPTGVLSVIANAGTTAIMDFNGKNFTTTGTTTLGGGTNGSAQIIGIGSTLTLGGDIVYDATNDPGGAVISTNIIGTGGNRTITVGDSVNAPTELILNGTFTSTSNNSLTLAGPGNGTINGNVTILSGAGTTKDVNFNGTGVWTINAKIEVTDVISVNSGVVNATVGESLDATNDIIVDGTGTPGSAIVNISSTSQVHTGDDIFIRNGGLINVTASGGIGTGTDQLVIGDSSSTTAGSAGVLNLDFANISVGANGIFVGNSTQIGHITGTGIITTTGSKDIRNGTIAAGITLAGNGAIIRQGLGTMTFFGARDVASTGATLIREGVLVLDYSLNNASKIGGALQLGFTAANSSPILIINGSSTESITEMVASTTILPSHTTVGINHGAGQTATLALQAITRSVPGGTVAFEYSSADSRATTTNAAGTLGWASLVTGAGAERFAAIDGSGNIVEATFTTQNDVTQWMAGQNIINDANFTGAIDCIEIDSLTLAANTASTLSINPGGHLRIATGGIMVDTSVGAFDSLITGGTLIGASGVSGEVIVHQNNTLGLLTIASDILNSRGITKTGAGTLVLSGNNSFVPGAEVNLSEGTLRLIGGNAIGDTTLVRMKTGTILDINNTTESVGHLTNESNGTIALGTTSALTLNQTANATYRGLFTGSAGSSLTVNAVNVGAVTGTLTYNLNITGATTTGFTGSVVVNAGMLQLSAGGRLANATAFTVNKSGTLLLDNNGGTRSSARILDTATITLNSADGTFSGATQVRGLGLRTDQNTTSNTSETVGVVIFGSGANYAFLDNSGGTSSRITLSTAGFERNNSATLSVRGRLLGDTNASAAWSQFEIGSDAIENTFISTHLIGGGGTAGGTAKNVSIVPWAIGERYTANLADINMGNTFVTYVLNSGFTPLNFNEYSTYSVATAMDNVRESLTADLTNLTGQTINSLVIHKNSTAASTINVTGAGAGQTLINTSGAFLFTQNTGAAANSAHSVILGGFDDGIQVGGSEYVFYVVNPSSAANTATVTATIESALITAADITKSGRGTLIFTASNTAGGGPNKTTINEGIIEISSLGNIGGATGEIVFAGGGLRLGTGFIDDLSTRTISILAGGATIDTNGADAVISTFGTGGSGSLTKLGDGTLTLNALAAYTGDTNIDGGQVVINAHNTLSVTGNLRLGSGVTVGALDLNGFDQTIGSLFVLANNASASVITVDSGNTLTINGDILLSNNTDAGNTDLTIGGGGAVVVNGSSIVVGRNTVGTNFSSEATLDLSDLSSFTAMLTGDLVLQQQGDNSASDPAMMILSNTANTLSAARILVGASSVGSLNTLTLGMGTNVINTDLIHLGSGGRDSGLVNFSGPGGSLVLRSLYAGVVACADQRVDLIMGIATSTTTAYTTANLFDVTGGMADLAIGTLTTSPGAKTANNSNELRFDQGTLDIWSINLAVVKGTGTSTNTISIGGGTVLLGGSATYGDEGTGSVSLATAGDGRLNITGGTVTTSVDLLRSVGTGTATITLAGGALEMAGHVIGSATETVALVAESGTLSNLGELNDGGDLTKTTAGTLILDGDNTYTGNTVISAGTLQLGSGTATGTLNTGSAISVDAGATFAVNQSDTVTQGTEFSGAAISGAGGFTQAGSGTTILNVANTYTGRTTITAGTLSISDEANLGGDPASFAADQLTFDGGILLTTATLAIDDSNRGITVGAGGGTFETATGTTTTVSSVITGGGTLIKQGDGTLIFTATNTNTGATNVEAGVLGGTGGVGGDLMVASGATLSPGVAGAGQFTVAGDLTIASGSTLDLQIGGATTNDAAVIFDYFNSNGQSLVGLTIQAAYETENTSLHDFLSIGGANAPVIDGTVRLTTIASYNPVYGDIFDLLDWAAVGNATGMPSFDFSSITLDAGLGFNTDLFASNGLVVVVPEPSRALLLLLGLLGLLVRRRRNG